MRGAMATPSGCSPRHLQIRAASYNENRSRLDWKDLSPSGRKPSVERLRPCRRWYGHATSVRQRHCGAWRRIPWCAGRGHRSRPRTPTRRFRVGVLSGEFLQRRRSRRRADRLAAGAEARPFGRRSDQPAGQPFGWRRGSSSCSPSAASTARRPRPSTRTHVFLPLSQGAGLHPGGRPCQHDLRHSAGS